MKKIPKKELGWSLETPLDQILIHQFIEVEIQEFGQTLLDKGVIFLNRFKISI